MDTKSLIQIPGYIYNEYLLVLNPHEELRNKIMEIKTKFSDTYKVPNARWSKPHITLANFVQFEMMEGKLVNRLRIIAMGYHPFKVELKGFGSFPSHTIFINVESQLQVKTLVTELRPAQRLMTLNKDNKPHFIDNPHLTVARKLLPWQYEQAWIQYQQQHFSGRFMANGMLLLKRSLNGGSYQLVQWFEFMNLPVNTRQGALFG
ncbi:MAG: 2'-5' RNA ligase family protein [Bacteroidota bacterium]|nr:2'-5' RNA ligase family protein [Bacteroidota bacterium]